MSAITVRRAAAEDGDVLMELILALAAYERLEPPDVEAQAR